VDRRNSAQSRRSGHDGIVCLTRLPWTRDRARYCRLAIGSVPPVPASLRRSSLAAPVILRALPGFAQDTWPARDIHVICGYAPGTGADIVVRLFAEKLRPFAKQTIVVENKPGAGTSIASEFVARAKPDGYTLFINPGNGLAGNPYLYKHLSHDVLK